MLELFDEWLKTYKLINIYLKDFPNYEKQGMCQEIRQDANDILKYIIASKKKYHKKTDLTNLDIKHDTLRHRFLAAYRLGYFGNGQNAKNSERFLKISNSMDNMGKLIGGWIKKENG